MSSIPKLNKYIKAPQFYAYAFNSCTKGTFKTGKNHVFFRLNGKSFQIIQSSNDSLIAEIDDIKTRCNNKVCMLTYIDTKTNKICEVLLSPCKEPKKYPFCPKVSTIEEWTYIFNQWVNDKKQKIKNKSKPKSTQEYSRLPELEARLAALKTGGKRKTRKLLPTLRKIDYTKKKTHYKLNDPDRRRHQALNEGVKYELKTLRSKNSKRSKLSKKNKQTMKKAATAKKARLNVLRIYRRNNNIKECNIITKDMMYLDKKYNLGSTKNICK